LRLATEDYSRRHLAFGWWTLLVFATLGLALESLSGFKVGAYLDVANETRRLLWRLAHAHGTLLGAINVLFALTLRSTPQSAPANVSRISTALIGATLLLPIGFFLGGVVFYSGDPGIGVLLVPVGGVLLLVAIFWIARGVRGGR
jgi:hypothetical protein